MMRTAWVFLLSLPALVPLLSAPPPSREELKAQTAQLQQTPNDKALREQVIKLAQTLKPAPAIPEEAREPFVMGATVLKKAGGPADAAKAADLFSRAIHIAPWFADAYYNRAVARETAGQYEPAMEDLRTYLLFKLPDQERREVQDKIYALKADAQLAEAKRAEEEKATAARLAAEKRRFEGNWYRMVMGGTGPHRQSFTVDRDPSGNWRLSGFMITSPSRTYDVRLEGSELKFKDENSLYDLGVVEYGGVLSEDGRRLNFRYSFVPPRSNPRQSPDLLLRFTGKEWLKE